MYGMFFLWLTTNVPTNRFAEVINQSNPNHDWHDHHHTINHSVLGCSRCFVDDLLFILPINWGRLIISAIRTNTSIAPVLPLTFMSSSSSVLQRQQTTFGRLVSRHRSRPSAFGFQRYPSLSAIQELPSSFDYNNIWSDGDDGHDMIGKIVSIRDDDNSEADASSYFEDYSSESHLPQQKSQPRPQQQEKVKHDNVNLEKVLVVPGTMQLLRYRGSEETLAAWEHGSCNIQAQCLVCQLRLACVADCQAVLCPQCLSISPVDNNNTTTTTTSTRQTESPMMGGVGIGIQLDWMPSTKRTYERNARIWSPHELQEEIRYARKSRGKFDFALLAVFLQQKAYRKSFMHKLLTRIKTSDSSSAVSDEGSIVHFDSVSINSATTCSPLDSHSARFCSA